MRNRLIIKSRNVPTDFGFGVLILIIAPHLLDGWMLVLWITAALVLLVRVYVTLAVGRETDEQDTAEDRGRAASSSGE